MTSLLTTAVDESCQNSSTLRGRRRSSVHPLSAVPRLFFSSQPNTTRQASSGQPDENAVVDDIELTPQIPGTLTDGTPGGQVSPQSKGSVEEISPLRHAHMSDYAPKMTIPKHQDSLRGSIDFSSCSATISPRDSTPPTRRNSRKGSYDNESLSNTHSLQHYGGVVQDQENFERMKWRLSSGYFAFFMCGWGDGITGTVLPFFMAEFHINFTTSSLLFFANTCGFLLGTLLIERIMRMLSGIRANQERSAWYPYVSLPALAKSPGKKPEPVTIQSSFVQSQHLAVVVGSLFHAMFFVLMGTRSGYPTLFVAYVTAAFARAILLAPLNLYFNTVLPQSLGYAYGLWSFGGAISPLICQTLVTAGVPWFQFYLGSLVLSAFNVGFLTLTFRPTIREWIKECHGNSSRSAKKDGGRSATLSSTHLGGNSLSTGSETKPAQRSELRWALSIGTTWAFSLFSMLYYGCDTTTQGFMVSYLLGTRHANPKTVGYVTAGFWGGITIGRFMWGYFMPLFSFTQRKWLVQLFITVGLIMELLIWFVNSNVGNAFFASIIGLVFGPVYPASLSLLTAILPQEVHMISMGLIGAAGSIGSAVFPLVTGVISSFQGIQVLPYVTVALAGSVFMMWFFFPSRIPGTH